MCLLPQGWHLDDVDLPGLRVVCDTDAAVDRQGIEVVGIPLGSTRFCTAFVNETLDSMVRNCESLTQLHPQCATKLLRESVCTAPSYIAQVCPPSVTGAALKDFDDRIWNVWLRILGCDEGELRCCDSAMNLARTRAFLPCRLDGAGLRCWERTSAFSWYCSMASCVGLSDPDLDQARQHLDWESEHAYDRALEALGGPSYLETSTVELIPVGENDALKGEFYQEWARVNKKLKLQKLFQAISDDLQRSALIALQTEVCDTSRRIVIKSIENSSAGLNLLTNLFTTPLSHRDSRLTKTSFITACRQFLCLPPLKNVDCVTLRRRCGCEYQTCANPACKGAVLDSHGSHGLVCHPGVKAQKATLFERALEKGFRRARGVPTRQPHTYDLFGGYFTKEDLSRLFPPRMNAEASQKSKDLAMELLDILRDCPRGNERTGRLGALRNLDFPPLSHPIHEDRSDVIRYDLRLPSTQPLDRPKEIWLDHAIVQETAATYANDVLEHLRLGHDPGGSPAFIKTQGKKLRTYVNMNSVVERLVIEKKLNFRPRFLFPVVSALGYFNDDLVKVLKFCGARFAEHAKASSPTLDGVSAAQKTGKYKRHLASSLSFALIRGNCLSVYNQGRSGVVTPA